ncbi:virion assembly protein [Brazilian porcupinepox virus 1]|nr:virion assembly protein [Brazilian porcupinepox virus 1]
MLVDDNTIIIYNKWPNCIVQKNKIIPFPNNNSYKFDNIININNKYNSILIINPNIIKLIIICVHLKRNKWKGNINILFNGYNKPPPFRLVNDN